MPEEYIYIYVIFFYSILGRSMEAAHTCNLLKYRGDRDWENRRLLLLGIHATYVHDGGALTGAWEQIYIYSWNRGGAKSLGVAWLDEQDKGLRESCIRDGLPPSLFIFVGRDPCYDFWNTTAEGPDRSSVQPAALLVVGLNPYSY